MVMSGDLTAPLSSENGMTTDRGFWVPWSSKLSEMQAVTTKDTHVVPTPDQDGSSSPLVGDSRVTFDRLPKVPEESLKDQGQSSKKKRKLWIAAVLVTVAVVMIGVIVHTTSSKPEDRKVSTNANTDGQRTQSTSEAREAVGPASKSSDQDSADASVVKSSERETGWRPPARLRKSWKSYTDDEKKIYLDAVRVANEKGYHYRFVEIHTARMNRITSHGACPFLLWHRRFILGYENMLRSLAPEFANVTLPYWNYFEDTNRQLASSVLCDNLEACSQFLRDMGGGGTTDEAIGQNLTISHLNVDIGTCVSNGIAGHTCNHPNGTASGQCHNCVMRGHWSDPKKIVQTVGTDLLGVLSVFNASSNDDAHILMSREIETSFHNAIHHALNSTMRYTSSAFDPIFMGHHAMVDLAQLIFNRCKYVPDLTVSVDLSHKNRDKKFDVFGSCDINDQDEVVHVAHGNESMQMTSYDTPVEDDGFMKQFFSGYGNRYEDVADAENLGPESSYTYQIDGYLQELLESHNVKCPGYLYQGNGRSAPASRRLSNGMDHDREQAVELMHVLASCGKDIARDRPELSFNDRLNQEGLIKCLVVEHRAGGILDDYDDAFRKMMKIPDTDSPYCVHLLRQYRKGDMKLLASNKCLDQYGKATGVDIVAMVKSWT